MTGLNAHIIGWGKYLPGKSVTNAELARTTPIDSGWIEERVGIQARHYAEPNQASADMGTRAARKFLVMNPPTGLYRRDDSGRQAQVGQGPPELSPAHHGGSAGR